MIYDNYGNFCPPIGHQKPDRFSCIDHDIPDRYTISVTFPDIIDNRVCPYAVQAIFLVKIFDGNKTANWLHQQEYDQEQEDSLMTIPLTAFIIPAKFFSEISEEWSMRHNAVIALSFFYSSTWFRIGKHRKNQYPLCTCMKNFFPRPVD
jgi:hypothetical protein